MCGISGIFSQSLDKKSREKAVQNIDKAQSLRGPDDSGTQSFDNLTFGHRRLSILDLTEAGHQPMTYKGFSVTYNGEIYNFKEIKEELEKEGYKFDTNTDTEVILKGYDKWGIEVIHKFRGMFAFALWDSAKEKLYLVRDRFGIKPLYYYSDKEKLVFSSSVKAIKKSGLVPQEKEKKAQIGFLLFGSVPGPYTTIKGVYALPSAYYMEIDSAGNQNLVQYYNLLEKFQKKSQVTDYQSLITNVRKLLSESVEEHLISDAPLGVFLSGGLDSSVIAALAAKNRENSLTTLSVDFDEKEFSEGKYQKMVSEKIGSEHKKVKITKDEFLENLEEAFEAMDQPTVDGINTYFISKAAKEAGLKAVLSGVGGDEIFLGYPYFKKAKLLKFLHKLPLPFGLISKILSSIKPNYSKLEFLKIKNPLGFYLSMRGLFTPREVADILDINKSRVYELVDDLAETYNLSPIIYNLHPMDALSYLELIFYMKNQLLKDTDFMSMHHSVEVRVPFLDHKLVEYLAGLPADIKLKGNFTKPLLIKAVEDIIPEEVYKRSKMGFTFPFQKWLKEKENFQENHWSRAWAKKVMNKVFN